MVSVTANWMLWTQVGMYSELLTAYLATFILRDDWYLRNCMLTASDLMVNAIYSDLDLNSTTQRSMFWVICGLGLTTTWMCVQALRVRDGPYRAGYRMAALPACLGFHGMQVQYIIRAS